MKMQVLKKVQLLGKEFNLYGDLDNPLFLAKDVAEVIDYTKTGNGAYDVSSMLDMVDEDEKTKIFGLLPYTNKSRKPVIATGPANRWFLTEDGVYEVIFRSEKPIAKQFKKEVKKVLKDIRQKGYSVATGNEQMIAIPDNIRDIGKVTRKRFTDAIKVFVDYAKQSGSQSYDRYYQLITNTIIKKLGITTGRDNKPKETLFDIERLEGGLSTYIKIIVTSNRPYKELYQEIKRFIELYEIN